MARAPSTTLRSLRELRMVPLPRIAALRGGGWRPPRRYAAFLWAGGAVASTTRRMPL